jgi:signal transduction histidine kinase
VRRWLACDSIELALDEPEAWLQPRAETSGARPAFITPADAGGEAGLAIEVSFVGRHLGTLRVGQKRGGALFTGDDIDLLQTIANQGALALAHARAYEELEERRQQQAAAWRGEREALVETVAAEIAHEVRYPLNFFRSVFERGARGEHFELVDVDIGREEVNRLERLLSGLRRMAAHHIERRQVCLSELCSRAEVLLRDSLGSRSFALEIKTDRTLNCDVDQVSQILVNLLANAIQATEEAGSIGISWADRPDGAELAVWDDGPGFIGDASRLFAPWYTTKPRGTGLGLAITHRLVRAHGWKIGAQRRGVRTVFAIEIPTSALGHEPTPEAHEAQVA